MSDAEKAAMENRTIDEIMKEMLVTSHDTRRLLMAAKEKIDERFATGAKIYDAKGYKYGEMLQAFVMGAEWMIAHVRPVTVINVGEAR